MLRKYQIKNIQMLRDIQIQKQSPGGVLLKKIFLKILHCSWESTCANVSFFNKTTGWAFPVKYAKCEKFKNNLFTEYPRATAYDLFCEAKNICRFMQ